MIQCKIHCKYPYKQKRNQPYKSQCNRLYTTCRKCLGIRLCNYCSKSFGKFQSNCHYIRKNQRNNWTNRMNL